MSRTFNRLKIAEVPQMMELIRKVIEDAKEEKPRLCRLKQTLIGRALCRERYVQ